MEHSETEIPKGSNEIAQPEFNFVGSLLVAVDGDIYSLKENNGTFEGYQIKYNSDGSIASYYELNEQDIEYLKQKGVLVVSGDAQKKKDKEEEHDLFNETKDAIIALYRKGDTFDVNRRLQDDIKVEIKLILNKLENISQEKQKELAIFFFDTSIMKEFNTKSAYQVYLALKGTTFSDYFKQLENLRLKSYGFGGFAL